MRRLLAAVLLAGLGACAPPRRDAPPPTFNRDIAPILFDHCAPCHRPGQEAVPFPLLSYADASTRAEKIARATRTRRMPPWLPDRGEPVFAGERGLSAA